LNTTDGITIRPATSEDAAAVHSMIIELARSTHAQAKVSSTRQDIGSAMSGSDPAMHALLAENDSKSVGLAVFFLTFSTWRGARGVYLQDLYVTENMRGTGLGKRLIAAVVAWATERGADHLRLSVDRDNASARAFYENIGLSFRDDEMIFDIVGKAFRRLGTDR